MLMTALVTGLCAGPLLFEAEQPGTEVLHPVAVVIFSGLISSTLLDTFLTPAMFWLFGRKGRSADGRQGRRGPLTRSRLLTQPTERTSMKTPTVSFARPGLAGSAFAAGDKHDHAHEHKPLHGGVVVEVKDMDYELVAKATTIQLPARPRQAADVSKASAKVTLLTGTEKQEVEPNRPAKARGHWQLLVGPGTKAVAVVTVAGKPATARFTLK